MPRKEASLPPSLVLPSFASTSPRPFSPSTSAATSPASPASTASSSRGTRDSVQTHSTVDSGYASSLGNSHHSYLPPHPDYMLSRTYENWKIADAATQRLFMDLRSLEECKEQLRKAKKRESSERYVCAFFSFCVASPPPVCRVVVAAAWFEFVRLLGFSRAFRLGLCRQS